MSESLPPPAPPDRPSPAAPGSSGGTPRWVKVFALVGLVLLVLFVISLLLGVRHGPGRHGAPSREPFASAAWPTRSV